MKKIRLFIYIVSIFLISFSLLACKEEEQPIKADNFYFAYNNIELVVGEEMTVPVVYEPFGAKCEGLMWHSSNEGIVSVDEGVLSPIGVGEVKISAWTDEGLYDEMMVTVVEGNVESDGEVEIKLSVDGAIYKKIYTSYEKEYKLNDLPVFDDFLVDETKPLYFEGWYLDKEFTNRVDKNTQLEHNCTIFAKFIKVSTSDFTYSLQEDGTAVITECDEFYDKTIVVPNKIDGHDVVAISAHAFAAEHDYSKDPYYAVRNLIIMEGIETIPMLTFCEKVETVVLPASVNRFSFNHLGICQTLKNIYVDEENQHFASISGNLYSKDGKILYKYCMMKEENSFIIPESVETIWQYAIYFNDPSDEKVPNLDTLVIGSKVKQMNEVAIGLDHARIDIHIEDMKSWCNIDFASSSPLYYSKNLYFEGKIVEDLVIPQGVVEIKQRCFSGLKVNSVTIPEGVEKIGYRAFSSAEMKKVTLPSTLQEIGEQAFYEAGNLEIIEFAPNSQLKTIERSAFSRTKITNLTLPEGLETIKEGAFGTAINIDKGTTIYIPDSVVSIEKYAFGLPHEYYQTDSKIYCKQTMKPAGWDSEWCSASAMDRVYWYSSEKPTVSGNFWKYAVDGTIYLWGSGFEA